MSCTSLRWAWLPVLLAFARANSQQLASEPELLTAAQQAQRAGDLHKAEQLFAQVLKRNAESPAAEFGLGATLYAEGNPQSALPHLKKVSQQSPGSFPAQLLLGMSYLKLGRPGQSITPLRAARTLKPDDEYASHNLNSAEYLAGNYRQAFADFLLYLAAHRDDTLSWYGLGETALMLAKSAATSLGSPKAANPYALQLFALTYAGQENWLKAEEYLSLLQREPGWQQIAEAELAEVMAHTIPPATRAPEANTTALGPKVQAASSALDEARALLLSGDELRAGAQLEKLFNRNEPRFYFWLSCLMGDEAKFALDRVMALAPGSVYAHLLQGQLASLRHQDEAAVLQYQEATVADPGSALAFFRLGDQFWQMSRHEEAVAALRHGLQLEPDNAHALYQLGHSLFVLQQLDQAESTLRQAIAIDPALAPAYADLGKLYRIENRRADAIAAWKRAAGSDVDGSINYLLFRELTSQGDRVQAQKYLARYKELDGQHANQVRAETSTQ